MYIIYISYIYNRRFPIKRTVDLHLKMRSGIGCFSS